MHGNIVIKLNMKAQLRTSIRALTPTHNTATFALLALSVSAMKETFHLRKKPTSKLKLVCSFNGEFHVIPSSNKLRYIGGETRIVSVDRNISFSKLRSNISSICPNIRSFTLKYQLPFRGRLHKDTAADQDTPLVLIASDEDVKCMVEEYDKLELYGKQARLWVFVFSEIQCDDNDSNRLYKGSSEDLSRKVALKQQLLSRQSKMNYEHPFMDSHLGFQPKFSNLRSDPHGEKLLALNGMGNARLHPLNPRDGNLRVETNGLMEFSGSGLCSGGESKTGNTSQSSMALNEMYDCGTVSICKGVDCKQGFSITGQMLTSNFNRENIMPWAVNCGSVKTHMTPNCSNQYVGSFYPVKSSCIGDRVSAACQNGIRNHRFGVNDGNHQINPYYVRNHWNNFVDAGSYRGVRFGGIVGICDLGTGPNSNISKPGQSMGLNNPNLLKLRPGFSEHALDGKVSVVASCLNKGSSCFDVQYDMGAFREQGAPKILQDGNSNLESHLGYRGTRCGVNRSLLSCNAIESPTSCARVIDAQEDFLTGSNFEKPEALHHTLHENIHEMSTTYASVYCDLENEIFLGDSPENANISGILSRIDHRNGIAYRCNLTNGTESLQGAIASSIDLLYNLSLSSSKEINTLHNSSRAGCVVSGALRKPQSKALDPVDGGQFNADPVADQLNRGTSSSSLRNAAKTGRFDVHGEEIQKDPRLSIEEKADIRMSHKSLGVIGGISGDLKAFCAHLSTGELQTIKNSDLEYIKEIGSGAYGTVFYGKWKGSDVAIKRMKPSCFTEDSLEGDRLVADFWREAHMLGQLHHPNIVAFYGVVSDGAASNLATVTEYMVNGSLKQVLRRKDRTVDRRKRLIIAMDAACGMEYLHEKNIVHFDLKSHNFLVNMRDPQRPVCKIGDLGLSKIKRKTLISGGVRGTLPWMAPELLNSKNNLVTEKIDVYSFGIVMWELLTGEEPYSNLHSEEIIAGIIKGTLRPEIPNWCDPTWRSLMERCWSSDPDLRPAFSEISKELRAMALAMNIK